MTTAENFKNFLMTNGHYDKFCNNLANQKNLSFEQVCDRRSLREVVDAGLTWHDCPEGSEFWSNLSMQWQDACDNGIQFTNRCRSIW